MKAVAFDRFGGPEVLHVIDLPEPHPGPGEVRIAVRAATVNPVDVMARTGRLAARFPSPPPWVAGMEVAGVVDEVGAGVDPAGVPAVGEPAIAFVGFRGAHGGYADQVVVPAASVTAAPRGLSMPEAASFLMNALTAQHALDTLALSEGATLLVTGAAGALGGYLTQLGSLAGLRVIALASAADEDAVRGFGASDFLARGADAVGRARALVPEGVDAVADAAGLGWAIQDAIRNGGQLVVFRVLEGEPERGSPCTPGPSVSGGPITRPSRACGNWWRRASSPCGWPGCCPPGTPSRPTVFSRPVASAGASSCPSPSPRRLLKKWSV